MTTDYDAIKQQLVDLAASRGYRVEMTGPAIDREWTVWSGGKPLGDDGVIVARGGYPRKGTRRNVVMASIVGVKDDRTITTIYSTPYHYGIAVREMYGDMGGCWMPNRGKRNLPHAGDILCSLLSDAIGADDTFADWCSNLGYDTDSRKAFSTYEACQNALTAVRRVFGEQLEAAHELAREL